MDGTESVDEQRCCDIFDLIEEHGPRTPEWLSARVGMLNADLRKLVAEHHWFEKWGGKIWNRKARGPYDPGQ